MISIQFEPKEGLAPVAPTSNASLSHLNLVEVLNNQEKNKIIMINIKDID